MAAIDDQPGGSHPVQFANAGTDLIERNVDRVRHVALSELLRRAHVEDNWRVPSREPIEQFVRSQRSTSRIATADSA